MSLLSTDITKAKRLSLRGVKLPAPELRVEPITPILVERPPSDEQKRIRKVELREDIKPHPEPEIKTQEIDKPKLIALAQRVIEGENSYSRGDIVARIRGATNVKGERAERGFSLILQAGVIEPTLGDRYYLTGSTPF